MSNNMSIFLPFIVAGIMNASFVIPIKFIQIQKERIWLYHAVIGLGIIPWLFLFIPAIGDIRYFFSMPPEEMVFLIGSGVIFGIGQVCFAYAIDYIGISLSFAINLGLAVAIGSLFVVFYQHLLLVYQGYVILLAIALILAALVSFYYSDREDTQTLIDTFKDKWRYQTGWILVMFAGFASGLQNIAFNVAINNSSIYLEDNSFYWVWPPFLLAAAIVMIIGFKIRLNSVERNPEMVVHWRDWLWILVMGCCFTGSLALYSFGFEQLNETKQVIGWPTMMISIILMSQIWGFIFGEIPIERFRNIAFRMISIALLLVAIVVLAVIE